MTNSKFSVEQVSLAPLTKGSWRSITRRIPRPHEVDINFTIINDHGDTVAYGIENRGDAALLANAKRMLRFIERYAHIDEDARRLLEEITSETVIVRKVGNVAQRNKTGSKKYDPFD